MKHIANTDASLSSDDAAAIASNEADYYRVHASTMRPMLALAKRIADENKLEIDPYREKAIELLRGAQDNSADVIEILTDGLKAIETLKTLNKGERT